MKKTLTTKLLAGVMCACMVFGLTACNGFTADENAALKNCLKGKHVADETQEVTYAWSDDYSTCTATVVCVHCENEVDEKATVTTDTTAGTITATFASADFETQTVYTVTDYDTLNTLLESGETVAIRLDAPLENINDLICMYETTAVLDMNGNNITFAEGCGLNITVGDLTLKGEGAITASGSVPIYCAYSRLIIDGDVTVKGDDWWYAIVLDGASDAPATVVINSGTFNSGTFNAQGNGVNFYFENEYYTLTITGGTFSCDPTEYVDTDNFTVTANDDSTWTVSCNH